MLHSNLQNLGEKDNECSWEWLMNTGPGSWTQRGHNRHNSADSVPTSNLVCIKEVAIRTTFNHMMNIAGIISYTCNLVIDIQMYPL